MFSFYSLLILFYGHNIFSYFSKDINFFSLLLYPLMSLFLPSSFAYFILISTSVFYIVFLKHLMFMFKSEVRTYYFEGQGAVEMGRILANGLPNHLGYKSLIQKVHLGQA